MRLDGKVVLVLRYIFDVYCGLFFSCLLLQKWYLLEVFFNEASCPTHLEQLGNARQLCQCHGKDIRCGCLLQESVAIYLEDIQN